MEGLKILIDQFQESLKFENEVLTQIKMAYMKLVEMLPEEDRMRVKIKNIVKNIKSDEAEIVKINVGGSIFYTLRSTLTGKIKKENGDEYYETHLLHGLCDESEENNGQIPFIDRDPTYFNYILDYLRDPNEELSLPEDEFILKKILREAKYFMLDALSKKVEDYLLLLSITFDSLILNKIQEKDLIKLCGFRDQQKLKILYRATKDGFSAANFHTKCDGQSNTLSIIKSTNGNIFGGFTTQLWSQIGNYVNDPDAFIFSLINSKKTPMKFDCKVPQYAINCHPSFGPSFGGGCDIYICNNSNTTQSSYSNLYHSY